MKFTINRDHFVSGLQKVQNVVSNRVSTPILGNVLISSAKDGRISLVTTNLDLAIRCQIKAQVEIPGVITLPVRKLSTIVKSLPNLEVRVEISSENQVKITSGGSVFRIMGMREDEFPQLPVLSESRSFKLPQQILSGMIKSVAYAQSVDENRHILNGIYFTFRGGKVTLVATDGRRLGLITQDLNIKEEFESSFILPAKASSELDRLLSFDADVNICFTDRQVAFEINVGGDEDPSGLVGDIYLVSRVVEGNYPNYQQVIPSETGSRIKIDRELFIECLSRAALVTSEKSNAVKLRLSPNLLEITSSSPELGDAHETMAIPYEEERTVELSFNPQFLIDPLKAISKDEIFFEFKDELSPGLLKTLDSFLCVIMPLRLN